MTTLTKTSPLYTPLCERLNIDVPIILAGMGTAAGLDLTAAVSNAGGLGVLGCTGQTPEEMRAPRLWTSDSTPERLQSLLADHDERMALISDEGGIFEIMAGLYSDGKANIDVFLQAHAGRSVRVDRGSRTVYLNKPSLSFGLAIQP